MSFVDNFNLDLLTPTEKKVAVLLSWGLTRKSIAEVMISSPTTIATHFSNIYDKLGFPKNSENVNLNILLASIVLKKDLEKAIQIDDEIIKRYLKVQI